MTPHSFRKTVSTIIKDHADFDIEDAAAQLGHSSPAVTRQHYIEKAAQVPDVRAAHEQLSPVFGG